MFFFLLLLRGSLKSSLLLFGAFWWLLRLLILTYHTHTCILYILFHCCVIFSRNGVFFFARFAAFLPITESEGIIHSSHTYHMYVYVDLCLFFISLANGISSWAQLQQPQPRRHNGNAWKALNIQCSTVMRLGSFATAINSAVCALNVCPYVRISSYFAVWFFHSAKPFHSTGWEQPRQLWRRVKRPNGKMWVREWGSGPRFRAINSIGCDAI